MIKDQDGKLEHNKWEPVVRLLKVTSITPEEPWRNRSVKKIGKKKKKVRDSWELVFIPIKLEDEITQPRNLCP